MLDVFPLKLQWLLRVPWQTEKGVSELLRTAKSSIVVADPKTLVQKAVSDESELKVTEILPRLKEGGAFVKFSHGANASSADVEASLQSYLKKKKIRPWWSPFTRVRARLVRGRPWVEDLHRLPSTRLRVEFISSGGGGEATELSQEQLYSLFRPYGKLSEITSQPADSKVQPRFATIDFADVRRSVTARNCLHGFRVTESEGDGKVMAVLRLTYERKSKPHWIHEWLFSHPRIVIPALAAIIATITVAIFDPYAHLHEKQHLY